jgi:hypothetical protein
LVARLARVPPSFTSLMAASTAPGGACAGTRPSRMRRAARHKTRCTRASRSCASAELSSRRIPPAASSAASSTRCASTSSPRARYDACKKSQIEKRHMQSSTRPIPMARHTRIMHEPQPAPTPT